MLKYIISLLLFVPFIGFSQEMPDSVRKAGIRIGYDLSNFALNSLLSGVSEQEANIDLVLTRKVFLSVEAGTGNFRFINEDLGYEYESSGAFFRMGLDYDFYNKCNDNIFIGFRYGYSSLKHSAGNFLVKGNYWPSYSSSFEEQNNHGSYFGVSGGIKVEVIKNLFLGFTLYGNVLTTKYNNDNFKPYYLFGYGKVFNNTSLGMNYCVYYSIPFRTFK